MQIKKLFAVYAAGVILCSCAKEEVGGEKPVNQGAIVLEQNTALRISPLVFAGCIDRLAKGTPVEVLERSAEKTPIAKTKDYWYHVQLDNGITGWIYGGNIKLVSVRSRAQMNSLIEEFQESESKELSKNLRGRWWSVNAFNDFTNHGLELYESRKYKSYVKGNEEHPIEGEYQVNVAKNQLIFPEGTTFKLNLTFAERGQDFALFSEEGDGIRFKRIQMETSPEGAVPVPPDGKSEGEAADSQSDKSESSK